jgi:hypothetical protein
MQWNRFKIRRRNGWKLYEIVRGFICFRMVLLLQPDTNNYFMFFLMLES